MGWGPGRMTERAQGGRPGADGGGRGNGRRGRKGERTAGADDGRERGGHAASFGKLLLGGSFRTFCPFRGGRVRGTLWGLDAR